MVKLYVFLSMMILSGCYDRFYGPSLRNEFNASIEITIKYMDGTISSHKWPPCFEAFAGKTDKPEDVIQEIKISKEGEVIHLVDAEQVQRLLEKEQSHDGYSAWSIGPDGILFETNPDPRCSKGKRVN